MCMLERFWRDSQEDHERWRKDPERGVGSKDSSPGVYSW